MSIKYRAAGSGIYLPVLRESDIVITGVPKRIREKARTVRKRRNGECTDIMKNH